MAGNEQSTSAPYSADVLNIRDKGLVFLKEFATNVNPDIGDAYRCVPGTPPTNAVADARTGLLLIQPDDEGPDDEGGSYGQSFLLPDMLDPKIFPTAPNFSDLPFAVIYAHFLGLEGTVGDDRGHADLILGGPGLVGDAFAEPFNIYSFSAADTQIAPVTTPAAIPDPFQQNGIEAQPFTNGTTSQDSAQGVTQVGLGIYLRIIITTDNIKASMTCHYSRDGLSWALLSGLAVVGLPVVRRIGIGVRGARKSALDWVRMYSFVPVTVRATGELVPTPVTGGRLFIP